MVKTKAQEQSRSRRNENDSQTKFAHLRIRASIPLAAAKIISTLIPSTLSPKNVGAERTGVNLRNLLDCGCLSGPYISGQSGIPICPLTVTVDAQAVLLFLDRVVQASITVDGTYHIR